MVKQLSGLEQTPITNKTNNLCCSFYETPQNPFLFILTTLLFCHIYFIVLTLILSSYTRVDLYCFSWVALWAAFVFINKAYYPNNYMMSVHSDQQEWDMQRLGLQPRVQVWEMGWLGLFDRVAGVVWWRWRWRRSLCDWWTILNQLIVFGCLYRLPFHCPTVLHFQEDDTYWRFNSKPPGGKYMFLFCLWQCHLICLSLCRLCVLLSIRCTLNVTTVLTADPATQKLPLSNWTK